MLDECATREQCARRVPDDLEASDLRAALRRHARDRGVRIRTARISDTVVAVRLDAAIWHDDTATMRAKLAPR